MNKTKVLSILAITLLILQIFSPNLGLMAESKTTAKSEDNGKVSVKQLDQKDDSIHWKVTVNALGEENNGTKTNVSFSSGHTHGSIEDVREVKVQKTDKGYEIETPAGNDTYELELMTTITSNEQTTFKLEAEVDFGEETYKGSDHVIVEKVVPDEVEADEEKEETKEKPNPEQSTVEQENLESTKSETDEEESDKEKQGEEQKSIEKIITELKKKPLNEFTEKEIQKLIEGLSEEELQKLSDEFQVIEEESVIDPNFHPFLKSARSFNMISNNLTWPVPGSVKLNGKDATPTDNYGEWEIELSVEAKDIDTTKSTDIVLVFDRSGSMQGNRLTKAKQAANQFVEELLTSGSQTRIAVVTFSDNYQTLAGGFQGAGGKQSLLNAINGISASGGTNIQGGLRTANNLLANNSSAQSKIIVLLSDGEPTYSYKATNATAHNWAYGSYNFKLSNFTNEQLGSGSSYNLSAPTCFLGFCWGGQQYSVNGYDVKTNGSATISEAWQVMNNGIDMYSIGLDVGNNNNATNVLRNSQNSGFYQAGQDDLGNIFAEIAGELKYAATNAVVTDPLGDMFNLIKGKYNGADFIESHGSVSWDENTETFTWNIGTIREGEKPTLRYTVTIDWEHPDLKGHMDYPMNRETPLNYTDANGNDAVKHFKIPKGQIDKGKIKRIGYRMNAEGEPIDEQGNVVNSKEKAQIFYDEYYEENNSQFFNYGTHNVPSKGVQDYTLYTDSPIDLTLSPNDPVQTAWFGYVKTSEMVAGDVTAKYVDEDGNKIASVEVLSGNIGDDYETEQKEIQGYEFKELHPNSGPASGQFIKEEQIVIYVYTKKLGSLTVQKVDENGELLKGAEFKLTDSEGFEATGTSDEDGKIIFDNLEWGTYTLVETKAPEGYRLRTGKMEVKITEENLYVEKTVENTKQDWMIPKTGGFGTFSFYGIGLILMVGAAWFFLRRHQV